MKKNLVLILAVPLLFLGCANIFKQMAKTTTDEALFFSANEYMASGDWTLALAEFDAMSAEYLAQREVKSARASAYAGRCGERFITLLNGMASTTDNLFYFLFTQTPSATATQQADCLQAETLLKELGATAALRTANENLLMAVSSLTKIGVVLNKSADLDQNNTVDQTADGAAFDPCDSSILTDADTQEIGTGLVLFKNSLAASGFIGVDALVAAFDTACTALATLNPAYDFCSAIDVADIDANKIIGIRSLVKEGSALGLGKQLDPVAFPTCATGDVSTCNCP